MSVKLSSVRLSKDEKQALADTLSIIFGTNYEFEIYKARFNEQTVLETEKALDALMQCNKAMKNLVIGLSAGSALLASGWLRKILQKFSSGLKNDNMKFNGIACRNVVALRSKAAILSTIY